MDIKEELKQEAAYRAVDYVESGMVLGLGTGSTTHYALDRIAELLREGKLTDIVGIPSSRETEERARSLGIPLTNFEDHAKIDLTIDGADEVDPQMNLIKGGGGALLREKIVAQNSRREIIIVDDSKLSSVLGAKRRLPIEVVSFGWRAQVRYIESLGAQVSVRSADGGKYFKTDQGNMILDCNFGHIFQPAQLAEKLKQHAGIVEHGLFIGCVSDLIVAGENGIRHLTSKRKGVAP
jgi:ribose 5-phosphate isomerase A